LAERDFTYAFNGDMLTDGGAPSAGGREFVWDAHGRLARVDSAAGASSKFAYDVLGRRVRKIVEPDASTTHVYDYRLFGDDVYEERRAEQGMTPELWVYVQDPTGVDRSLRWDRYRDLGGSFAFLQSYVPVTDARNNVIAVRTKTASTELEYNLYGEELDPDHGMYIPYRFAGREFDPDTGLYYNRSRYYAPDLGRFISVDSIGIWGDLNNYGNGYAYVGNMGNALLDPFGLLNEKQKKLIEAVNAVSVALGLYAVFGPGEAFAKEVAGGVATGLTLGAQSVTYIIDYLDAKKLIDKRERELIEDAWKTIADATKSDILADWVKKVSKMINDAMKETDDKKRFIRIAPG
jgi:RHS repeat-associated protein